MEESISSNNKQSYFDGGLLQLIGWMLLGGMITFCTFGICYPWAFCMVYRWEAKHTVINGNRLQFDGTAMQLFGKWILWMFLSVITFGIYVFWLNIALKKWKVKHTRFIQNTGEPQGNVLFQEVFEIIARNSPGETKGRIRTTAPRRSRKESIRGKNKNRK